MASLSFIQLTTIHLSFLSFLQDERFIFLFAIITFALCIVLRAPTLFLIQLFLLIGVFTINTNMSFHIVELFMILQILLSIYTLFRVKRAIDYNYYLVLEKTHQAPKKYTTKGASGTKITF